MRTVCEHVLGQVSNVCAVHAGLAGLARLAGFTGSRSGGLCGDLGFLKNQAINPATMPCPSKRRRALLQRIAKRPRMAVVPEPQVQDDPLARLPGPARLLVKDFVTGWTPTPSAQCMKQHLASSEYRFACAASPCRRSGCPCYFFKLWGRHVEQATRHNHMTWVYWNLESDTFENEVAGAVLRDG